MLLVVAHLRLEIACGVRREVHVVDAAEVAVGSASTDDVTIDHPTVEVSHARIALRRDRLLVIPNPRARRSVRVGARVIGAPVAVAAGACVRLGEISVEVAPGPTRPIEVPSGVTLGREHASAHDVRRFEAATAHEPDAELMWSLALPDVAAAWLERVRASAAAAAPPPILGADHAASGLGVWALERVGRGVRLATLLRAVRSGAVFAPREAAVMLVAQLAAALAGFHRSWGVHGALDGRVVHLGADGRVVILRPGPTPGEPDRERRRYLAPERRRGGQATATADAWAIARWAYELGAAPAPWARLAEPDPSRRPTDLIELAELARIEATSAGLDPSTRHLAQLVDLVSPPSRPLARVNC